jgi:hypothetical protein
MKREKLKKILKYFTEADSTIRNWLNGTRKPSYPIMLKLNKDHDIPFEAWADIKAYIKKEEQK